MPLYDAPAFVRGNCRDATVAFELDSHSSLVDILHYCEDCGMETVLPQLQGALWWPAFFSDTQYDVHCTNCGQIINEAKGTN